MILCFFWGIVNDFLCLLKSFIEYDLNLTKME